MNPARKSRIPDFDNDALISDFIISLISIILVILNFALPTVAFFDLRSFSKGGSEGGSEGEKFEFQSLFICYFKDRKINR